MAKAKPILFSVLYVILYTVVQIVVGVALSFTNSGIVDSIQGIFDVTAGGGGQDAINSAMLDAYNQINAFLSTNLGAIVGVASLVSLIFFTLIYRARKKHFFSATLLDARPETRDMWFGLSFGAGFLVVSSLVILALSQIEAFQQQINNYNQVISNPIIEGNLLMTVLGVGIIVPIVEEAMYRGMILGELAKAFPVGVAIAVQGVLFGLMHGNVVQLSFAVPLGVLLGYCVHKTQTLWVGIAAHVAMNTVSVLTASPAMEDFMSSELGSLAYLSLSLMLFSAALAYFIRRKQSPEHVEKDINE